MILYRLFENDMEYGYDIFISLYKNKNSMMARIKNDLETQYKKSILNTPYEENMRVVADKDKNNFYYIEYDISNYSKSHEKYGKEIYTTGGYGYEIIDTDTLQ